MSVDNAEENVDDSIYHYDFTTASSWEIFIARIEEIIYQWKLSVGKRKKSVKNPEFSKLNWQILTEEVLFADIKLTLSWHKGESCDEVEETKNIDVIEEAMSIDRDFAFAPHIITSYFGISEFVVLDSVNIFLSHSKLNTLTSAVTIAVTNAQCEIPFFVRALDPKQNFYVGVACSLISRTHFDMVDLKKVPQQCQHLTGLTHIFKSNLKKTCNKGVLISARLSYQLKNWTSFAWNKEQSDIDFSESGNMDAICKLPLGCLYEPIAWLCVRAIWSGLPEGSIVDGPGYSDLDPSQAPKWTMSVGKMDDIACLLTEYLLDFTHFCTFIGTNHELIGDLLARYNITGYNKSLSSLTESRIPRLSDLIFSDSMKRSFEEPIPRKFLLPILYFLFPDSDKSRKFLYQENDSTIDSNIENSKYKTCSEDSLVWRLTLALAYVLHSFGGPRAAAHLWHEFAQELRFRWESSTLIPGVEPGLPNGKTCLIHQKLQMINCSIKMKLEREKSVLNQQESEDSDDEFYDAESDEFEGKVSLWNLPAGRLEKHPSLKILSSGNPLYVPKTQPPVPKTDDQVEEDDQTILSLGTSSEATLLRAKLMSASLLSDMESFKAANPGAGMEDFIRWYSPWDWIEKKDENGDVVGKLSPRMLVEGNQWLELWTAAKPVPAHRQKRLFDETREAERALHMVESAGPAEAASYLLPVLFHASMNTLSPRVHEVKLNNVSQAFDKTMRKIQNRTRSNIIDVAAYLELITEIGTIECVLSQIKSLEYKFDIECGEDAGHFIGDLIIGETPEIEVPNGPNGPVGIKIKSMFTEAYRVDQMLEKESEEESNVEFGHVIRPDVKEFILRLRDGDTAQRLTASIYPNRITMASLSTQSSLLC